MGSPAPDTPRWMRRAGAIITVVVASLLVLDASGKLFEAGPVVEGSANLGYSPHLVRPLGLVLLSCVALYVTPPVAIWGALLLTGYLGGAVASHLRIGSPVMTHVLFPVYVAALAWAGLALRDIRLRQLIVVRAARAATDRQP